MKYVILFCFLLFQLNPIHCRKELTFMSIILTDVSKDIPPPTCDNVKCVTFSTRQGVQEGCMQGQGECVSDGKQLSYAVRPTPSIDQLSVQLQWTEGNDNYSVTFHAKPPNYSIGRKEEVQGKVSVQKGPTSSTPAPTTTITNETTNTAPADASNPTTAVIPTTVLTQSPHDQTATAILIYYNFVETAHDVDQPKSCSAANTVAIIEAFILIGILVYITYRFCLHGRRKTATNLDAPFAYYDNTVARGTNIDRTVRPPAQPEIRLSPVSPTQTASTRQPPLPQGPPIYTGNNPTRPITTSGPAIPTSTAVPALVPVDLNSPSVPPQRPPGPLGSQDPFSNLDDAWNNPFH